MQIIKTTLKVKSGQAIVSAVDGHELTSANLPQFKLGVMAALDLDVRSDNIGAAGELQPYPIDELSSADAFYFALDADWDHKSEPPLFCSDGIKVMSHDDGTTHIFIPLPNTATTALAELLKNKESLQVNAEITGYQSSGSNGNAIFSFSFKLKIANRIFLNDVLPDSIAGNPLYPTTAEIKAMIDAATRSETPGPKGDKGDKGDKGENGKSSYDLYCDAEVAAGREPMNVTEWLENQKGAPGMDGRDGIDGKGLDFDAVGEAADRPLYDDEPKGFKFASSVTSPELLKTTIYVYTKLSDANGDWSEALIIDFYGSIGNKLTVGKAIEVAGRTEGAAYFYFETEYPNACIVAVSIDTEQGEEFLPLVNDYGIRKIIRSGNRFNVYYGASCPNFTKGHIYMSQMVITGEDNSDIIDVVDQDMYYGYFAAGTINSISEITKASLESAIAANTMIPAKAEAKEISLGNIDAGNFMVVLVPEKFTARKSDGIGGWTAFNVNAGAPEIGADGAVFMIDNIRYKIYGEFKLSTSEEKIYVSN